MALADVCKRQTITGVLMRNLTLTKPTFLILCLLAGFPQMVRLRTTITAPIFATVIASDAVLGHVLGGLGRQELALVVLEPQLYCTRDNFHYITTVALEEALFFD